MVKLIASLARVQAVQNKVVKYCSRLLFLIVLLLIAHSLHLQLYHLQVSYFFCCFFFRPYCALYVIVFSSSDYILLKFAFLSTRLDLKLSKVELLMKLHLRATGCHLPYGMHSHHHQHQLNF